MPILPGAGRKRVWKTGEEFIASAEEYADHCEYNDKFMNVSGFCRFMKISRETFYKQQEYYPTEYGMVNDIIEDMVINNDKTTMSIFYLKNKFGYKDKIETENVNTNQNIDMSHLSTEDIKGLLAKENEN